MRHRVLEENLKKRRVKRPDVALKTKTQETSGAIGTHKLPSQLATGLSAQFCPADDCQRGDALPLGRKQVRFTRNPSFAVCGPETAPSCAARCACSHMMVLCAALGHMARLEPQASSSVLTTIPAPFVALLRAELVLAMSENAAPQDPGAGELCRCENSADLPRRRAKLLTTELAEECATKMFTKRADGPHPSGLDTISDQPTIEEIVIAQAAALEAIGEKGSEKRAHANGLCARGMIDLEEALGYLLFDIFVGMIPSEKDARAVGKRAADKPPGKKEKERWKEKAKAARQAAKKAGADEEAVVAAGTAARAQAQAAFIEARVAIGGLERAADVLEPPPAVPEPPPPELPPMPPEGTPARVRLDMIMSREAAPVIAAAYTIAHRTHPRFGRARPLAEDEQLELAQVQLKHALRRLKAAHPDALEGCPWDEHAARSVVSWTVDVHSTGHVVPATVAAARRVKFDLDRAAADARRRVEREIGVVV